MFQNSIALHPLKLARSERKPLGVRHNVHSGQGEQIQVDISPDFIAAAADIEIPPPQREIRRLVRVLDERLGWFEEPR